MALSTKLTAGKVTWVGLFLHKYLWKCCLFEQPSRVMFIPIVDTTVRLWQGFLRIMPTSCYLPADRYHKTEIDTTRIVILIGLFLFCVTMAH